MKEKFFRVMFLTILVLGTAGFALGNSSFKKITGDRAKQIALARVPGATKDHIRKFEGDKDSYDGIIIYNGVEYDFEIDAFTGRIIDWDVEKK